MTIITGITDFINSMKSTINKYAVETGFKVREGKLKVETFVIGMSVGQTKLHEVTLDALTSEFEDIQEGLRLTKQALEQRLKAGALLMENVFNNLFSELTKTAVNLETIEVLKQFKDVKFTDGSTISLCPKLKQLYKGLGGKNSESALKIQATYSLFKNELVNIDIYSATKNDCTYNEITLEQVEANELIIKDLGYYDGEYFKSIDEKNAFFISRIKKNTNIYEFKDEKYVEIDIKKLLKKAKFNLDKKVFIKLATGEMYETRLVGIKLPEKVCNERKRKAYKTAKSKDKQLSEKEIVLLDWFLLITNVSEDILAIETICELYRLRWQIELQFKALKSSLDLDRFGLIGEDYFKCLLYGKLIMVLLTMRLFSICRTIKFKDYKKLISIQKFVRLFRNKVYKVLEVFKRKNQKNIQSLEICICKVANKSFFDTRIRKTTEYELMTHDIPENVLSMLVAEGF